jgi:multiple sugar transport system permease protein
MRRDERHHDNHDLDFFSAAAATGFVPDANAESGTADRPADDLKHSAKKPSEGKIRALSVHNVYFTADFDEKDDQSISSSAEEGEAERFRPKETDDQPTISVFDELDESVAGKRRIGRYIKLHRRVIRNKVVTGIFFTVVLAIAILAILPIVLTILNSFMASAEIRNHYGAIYESLSGYTGDKSNFVANPKLRFVPDMVSVDQYTTLLLKTPAYLLKFWNSVLIVVPIVVGQMIVGSLAAFAFARHRRKWSEALFFSYIILMLMPHQVTLVPNLFIADTLNIYGSWWAIILPGVFSTFSVFLLSKYMRQIPSSYIEAAKLDGAGEWHIFWSICLPMCKSALYAMSILLFIDYWNMVEQPLLMLENKDLYPMSVFLSQINQKELGVAFAASTIFMIPPLLMFFNGEEYLIEGISRSGIK